MCKRWSRIVGFIWELFFFLRVFDGLGAGNLRQFLLWALKFSVDPRFMSLLAFGNFSSTSPRPFCSRSRYRIIFNHLKLKIPFVNFLENFHWTVTQKVLATLIVYARSMVIFSPLRCALSVLSDVINNDLSHLFPNRLVSSIALHNYSFHPLLKMPFPFSLHFSICYAQIKSI